MHLLLTASFSPARRGTKVEHKELKCGVHRGDCEAHVHDSEHHMLLCSIANPSKPEPVMDLSSPQSLVHVIIDFSNLITDLR